MHNCWLSLQATGSSLLAGKTALDERAQPGVSTAPKGLAQESAFGRADASFGSDFATSGSQVQLLVQVVLICHL